MDVPSAAKACMPWLLSSSWPGACNVLRLKLTKATPGSAALDGLPASYESVRTLSVLLQRPGPAAAAAAAAAAVPPVLVNIRAAACSAKAIAALIRHQKYFAAYTSVYKCADGRMWVSTGTR
jgi:hypothetical protein